MNNEKRLWNKHRTESVKAEKIKRIVVQPMTLVMLDDNDREADFYVVQGCFAKDCNKEAGGIGLGDFDTKDEAITFAKNLENIIKKERI